MPKLACSLSIGLTVAWFASAAEVRVGLQKPGVFDASLSLIEWRFESDGDLRGWAPGGHIRDVTVSGGALTGEIADWDPSLLGPVFEIPAGPTQWIEIKMRATDAGRAQLFWTETLEGKYGGFSEEKSSHFQAIADGEFHVYRIHPFWHAAEKIIRMRLDPPSSGKFEIQWIRIVDAAGQSRSQATMWTFSDGIQGWQAWQDVAEPIVADEHLEVRAAGPAPILMSPVLAVSADEHPYVSVRMAVDRGSAGRIVCVSSSQNGLDEITFPLRADGRMHSYDVDVGNLAKWQDEIILLGLQPSDAKRATARIESIEIADAPRGPAELEIGYFGRGEGVARVGRPAQIVLLARNRGGKAAQDVAATLRVPDGVRLLGSPRQTIDQLGRYLPKTVSWRVEASAAGLVELVATLEAPGVERTVRTATVEFTPVPQVPVTSYVPEPQPVESKHEVGVFYFPGWHSTSRWQPILDFPMRKPVLGWYDESNPECADWQIKWAVEHGVTFFMVDWYWSAGHRQLEHWLHDAYMKARYRRYLKWAVMWANHNRPGTHSLEDWRNVTRYWIDHYFGMEEYYRIDGRPAVFIWSPGNVRRDLGSSDKAAELYALSQKMAREAGYPGICFAAMSSHESEGQTRQLAAEGYEAFTSYHGFQLAAGRAGGSRFPFADVVETAPEVWQAADERSSGPVYMPIVDTGWASEPWHRSKARVITGRTPELFGALCRKAARYAGQTGKKIIAVGPCNEWGEGSYIEPYAEYGFDDLDQLRAAFCPPGEYPPNVVPSDVGLGPYDLPPVALRTAWQFDDDDDFEGWTPNGQLKVRVADGLLAGESTGHDPILQGPGVQIEAATTRQLSIRMRASADDRAQLFWGTTVTGPSEANSVRLDLIGDGQFHEYTVDLGACRQWRGLIVSLRFDPVSKRGVRFAVDSVRFQ
ncbi:MAG: glycoside hydrolase family 99-like domain-containing protein [Planctomycetota bacterium]|jgi:hypothetical protein